MQKESKEINKIKIIIIKLVKKINNRQTNIIQLFKSIIHKKRKQYERFFDTNKQNS
jgi:hypothetical protein